MNNLINLDKTHIGKQIKRIRIFQQLTQKDLSTKSGLSLSVIKKAENDTDISLDTFLVLIKTLGYMDDLQNIIGKLKPLTINQHQSLANGTYKEKSRVRK